MNAQLVYSKEYDLYLPLLEHLHPFDGRKYSRAYGLLRDRFGDGLDEVTHAPTHEAETDDLLRVHTESYLASLDSADVLARALEIPALLVVSSSLRRERLIKPMLLAVQGTIQAAELALRNGLAFHLGGGFHHAFADHGEGFCIYADTAIAIRSLRARQLLEQFDKVVVIDLDAHRGNGSEHIFAADLSVQFFDMYNFQIYPGPLDADEEEAPYIIPIKSQTKDQQYLQTLSDDLPRFLSANDGHGSRSTMREPIFFRATR